MNRLEKFRRNAREWLEVAAAEHQWADGGDAAVRTDNQDLTRSRECQKALFDGGYAGLSWPKEFGGQGLGFEEQIVFNEEARRFDLPLSPFIIGLGMCGPTLLALGTAEQKQRYLPKMLSGEEIWCQLFSEPDAGSDVAGLKTRASRDGADWVITGQKIWTSGAHDSDFGILLARTDFDAPKHRGITMFIVAMKAEGIDIRPIHQMDGGSRFNEVYLDSVRVPASAVVGQVGDGWRAATTTLANERVSLGAVRTLDDVPSAAALFAKAHSTGASSDPRTRQQLVDVWTRERIVRLLGDRVTTAILAGNTPGPQGSIAKLSRTEYTRKAAQLAAALDRASALAWIGTTPPAASALLYAPCLSIAGGTDEVLRNIIGERVLGLPREPSVDRDTPFRETTRSQS